MMNINELKESKLTVKVNETTKEGRKTYTITLKEAFETLTEKQFTTLCEEYKITRKNGKQVMYLI